MANNLKLFGERMKRRGEQIEQRAGTLLGVVSSGIVNGVVPRTPIKSGMARRNWQVQINSAPSNILPAPVNPGDGEREALGNASKVLSTVKSGSTVHITNNAPHIAELNNGSSMQAPAMFVQIEVINALGRIKDFRLLI